MLIYARSANIYIHIIWRYCYVLRKNSPAKCTTGFLRDNYYNKSLPEKSILRHFLSSRHRNSRSPTISLLEPGQTRWNGDPHCLQTIWIAPNITTATLYKAIFSPSSHPVSVSSFSSYSIKISMYISRCNDSTSLKIIWSDKYSQYIVGPSQFFQCIYKKSSS